MTNNLTFYPVSIWLAAGLTAVMGTVLVYLFGDSAPWVIVIPIAVGAVVVGSLQLFDSKEEIIRLLPSEEDLIATNISEVDERNWPVKPVGLIEIEPEFEAYLTSIIVNRQKLVLTGQRGAGKTTCAVGLCRKYEELNGASPVKRTPVFISFSHATRTNGLASMFLGQISDQLGCNNPSERIPSAKQLMKDGSIFLVVDDLDYMTEADERDLKKFVTLYQKNAYLCIISDVPQGSFLAHDFVRVELPEWEPSTVRSYIDRRVTNVEKKGKFLASLEQAHILEQRMAPWQANFLVGACLDGTYYKLLRLGELKNEMDYVILDDYLCIMMADSKRTKYLEKIHQFGRLAMKLIKEGRSVFVPEAEGISRDCLVGLMPKLFVQQGEFITFSHGNYQTFLAGRYISEFWIEARTALQDAGARIFIWKAVYSCAIKFSSEAQIREIEEIFQRLAK